MKTHIKKINKKSCIIFTCEHASSRIPKELNYLGVSKNYLKNCKDLYDPFAFDLFKKLAKNFNSSYIYSNLSRLVIDMNRNIGAKNKDLNTYHSALIKKQILVEEGGKEFFVNIPHNQDINFEKEEKMYNSICRPYQEDIKKIILKLQKNFQKVYIISVHTMFPKYNGPLRKVEMDLIGDENSKFFKKIIKEIRIENNKLNKKYSIGVNKPWGFKDVDNGAFHEIISMPNVEVMALEIRNDVITTKSGINNVFNICKNAIKKVCI